MERADGLLRVTYVHYILSMDKHGSGNSTWKPVLELFTTDNEAGISKLENNRKEVLEKLLIDSTNNNSLKSIVSKARENARGMQDYITKEVWEEINGMYHSINQPGVATQLNTYEAVKVIQFFTRHCVSFTGVTDITMPRGTGWNFMNVGKHIERCLQTIVIADKHFAPIYTTGQDSNDVLQWRYLLLALSGYELHLKTYRTTNHQQNVVHQIVLNENFTRSVLYSLSRINFYLQHITGKNEAENTALVRSFGRLYSKVLYADLEMLTGSALKDFLDDVKAALLQFNKQLSKQFFSYS